MGETGSVKQGPVLRSAHIVLPWIALLALGWVLASMWGSFQLARQAAELAGPAQPSSVQTATTQPSVVTTVTGLAAVALQDVKMRLRADLTSEVIATSRQGSKLTIIAKQGLFLRVKDAAGHMGWVPNDVQYLQVTRTTK